MHEPAAGGVTTSPGAAATGVAARAGVPGGALRRAGPSRAPRLIAWAAVLFALLMLGAAVTGAWFGLVTGLQGALLPDASARGVVRGLGVSVSIGLLIFARGLSRRQRRAWTASVLLTATGAALLLVRDLDLPSAFAAAGLLGALLYWRREFYATARPPRPARAVAVAALVLAAIFAYGTAAARWHAASAGPAQSLASAMSRSAWGMVGQNTAAVADEFSRTLVATLTVAAALTVIVLASVLLRPPRGGATSSEREWREARRLVTAHGDDSLAYFALRRDKHYFFDDEHTVFLAYRELAGIALVSGDPIGAAAGVPRLLEAFASYARGQAWRIAVIGVGEGLREAWETVGLRALYVGDEAVVPTASFSLEGRAVRKLRQSVNRLQRLGYTAEWRRAGELSPGERDEVVRVSEIWRGGQPERGFSMALEDVRSTELDDTLFVLGRDAAGGLAGFLHFVPAPATGDLSLSAMRRLPDTPNGFNEFLVSSVLTAARDRGIARVSLNFAVFGGLLRDEGSGPVTRVAQRAVRFGDRFFQLERLLAFNRKFGPEWVPRYLAVESRADVPEVALVVLRLENLLARGAAEEGPSGRRASRRGAAVGPDHAEEPSG
jgi:lysyl-tRNA synthetase, class II